MTHTLMPEPLTAMWDWRLQAACRSRPVETFFHPPGERNRRRERRIAEAKKVCADCPVLAQCRDYALKAREPYGIWGGLSESERADALGVVSLIYPGQRSTHSRR